jgi:hypothetical protein
MLSLASFIFLEELIELRTHVKTAVVGGGGRRGGRSSDAQKGRDGRDETFRRGGAETVPNLHPPSVVVDDDTDNANTDEEDRGGGGWGRVGGQEEEAEAEAEVEDVFSPPASSSPAPPAPSSSYRQLIELRKQTTTTAAATAAAAAATATPTPDGVPAAAAALPAAASPAAAAVVGPSIVPPFSPQFAAFLAASPMTIDPERGMRVAPALRCPRPCAHGGWCNHQVGSSSVKARDEPGIYFVHYTSIRVTLPSRRREIGLWCCA